MKEKAQDKLPNINLNHSVARPVNNELEVFRRSFKRAESWTQEEVEALQAGVSEFGEGNWSQILSKYKEKFSSERRIVDLASKHRLLSKQSSYYNIPKKDWVQLDEDGNPIESWEGDIITVSQRFPYDAAMRFAKRQVASGSRKFHLTVREAQDIGNVHTYAVEFVLPDKITMKKLVEKRW